MLNLSQTSLVALVNLQASFIIPSYQRAYRWGKKQIEDLLNDFYDFAMGRGTTFFLQPLVLSHLDAEEETYELIDGQQRLTTLYILDAALCHLSGREERGLHYSIIYKARKDLKNFLNGLSQDFNIIFENAEESLDLYCLIQARQIILEWLSNKNMGEFLAIFHDKLLNNIKFLWHDCSDEKDSSPVKKFIRINTGKIPLEDGELCRALFLIPENHNLSKELPDISINTGREFLEHIQSHLLFKHRLILAHGWDQMERSLWDDEFWNFIGGTTYKASVRMGFLLELHNNVKASIAGGQVCFNKYVQEFKKISTNGDAAFAWAELVKTMERLRYWYRNNDYYHWIGYLILINGYEELAFLLREANILSEDEFKTLVKDEIRKSVSPDKFPPLDELSFLNNYALCKNILILFNIEYSRRHQGHSPRFPFLTFSLENNTIEHVYARNVESLKDVEDRIQWIVEHRNFVDELCYEQFQDLNKKQEKENLTAEEFFRLKKKILKKADNYIEEARRGEKLAEEILTERFNSVSSELSNLIEHHEDEDVHSLYNLALLDHNLNSYFKNSIFAIKQKKLRNSLREGSSFIPAGTIALFMRYFARDRREEPWWTREDQEDYRLVLWETLSEFWSELKINESLAMENKLGQV